MSGHLLFLKFSAVFSRIFSTRYNPFFHLGTLAIYFFAIAFVSGIYLFLFYKVDPTQAYNSTVEIMNQWVGNVMRNMHRYSSDLFMVFVFLHFIHMLVTGKFKRMKSWLFGIVALLITVLIGLTGFVLVWDQKAKLLGLLTAKLLIYLPFFDPSIAGAFLINDLAYLGGIFRVTLFAHIFFCAFTAIFLWLHETHLSKPGIFPPKKMMVFAGIFTLVISLFFDASIDAPAESSVLPTETGFNWYYFFGYYFMKILSVGWNWVLIVIVTLFIFSFPFLFKKEKLPIPSIDLSKCDGCKQCADDCPYDAIRVMPDENGKDKANLMPEKCVGCNICIGSCKDMAISSEVILPSLLLNKNTAQHQIISCRSLRSQLDEKSFPNTQIKEVICIGDIHAKSIDELSLEGENKLIFVGCESCYFRFGPEWAQSRINRNRRPLPKPSAPFGNMLFVTSGQAINKTIQAFLTAPVTKQKEIQTASYKNISYVPAIILTLAFFCIIPYFSNREISFYDANKRTLILNLKYTSSPVKEMQHNSAQLSHMQSPIPIITGRSDIYLMIFDIQTRKTIYIKKYEPRGLRKDIAVYVYDEVEVPENVLVFLVEKEFPEIRHSSGPILLDKGESRLLRFESGKLHL